MGSCQTLTRFPGIMCLFWLSGNAFLQALSVISHRNLTPRLSTNNKTFYHIPAESRSSTYCQFSTKLSFVKRIVKVLTPWEKNCPMYKQQCFHPSVKISVHSLQNNLILSFLLSPILIFSFVCWDIPSLLSPSVLLPIMNRSKASSRKALV